MKENGWLSNLRLLEFLIRTTKHDFSYLKTENLISQVEMLLSNRMIFVQVLTHTNEL